MMNIISYTNPKGQIIFIKNRGIEKACQMLESSTEDENLSGAKLIYQLIL